MLNSSHTIGNASACCTEYKSTGFALGLTLRLAVAAYPTYAEKTVRDAAARPTIVLATSLNLSRSGSKFLFLRFKGSGSSFLARSSLKSIKKKVQPREIGE